MPRNMSFFYTKEQFQNKTKTVTRRLGWWFLKSGDIVMGVEKGRGVKKGELNRLGLIQIVSSKEEKLCDITKQDVIKEGFCDMSPYQFIEFFCKHRNVTPYVLVNRIEYKYLDCRYCGEPAKYLVGCYK